MAATLGPCVLEGNHVRLEPLSPSHAGGLLAAAQESDWTWLTVDPREKDAMDEWIRVALKAEERASSIRSPSSAERTTRFWAAPGM